MASSSSASSSSLSLPTSTGTSDPTPSGTSPASPSGTSPSSSTTTSSSAASAAADAAAVSGRGGVLAAALVSLGGRGDVVAEVAAAAVWSPWRRLVLAAADRGDAWEGADEAQACAVARTAVAAVAEARRGGVDAAWASRLTVSASMVAPLVDAGVVGVEVAAGWLRDEAALAAATRLCGRLPAGAVERFGEAAAAAACDAVAEAGGDASAWAWAHPRELVERVVDAVEEGRVDVVEVADRLVNVVRAGRVDADEAGESAAAWFGAGSVAASVRRRVVWVLVAAHRAGRLDAGEVFADVPAVLLPAVVTVTVAR